MQKRKEGWRKARKEETKEGRGTGREGEEGRREGRKGRRNE